MQAYHRNIRYPSHLLLTYQWYSPNWWLVEDQNYTCTGEQRGEVLHMTLSVNIFNTSHVDTGNYTTSMNIVGGEIEHQFSLSRVQGYTLTEVVCHSYTTVSRKCLQFKR